MFFLINEKAIIATPDSLARSERTVDIPAEQLASDYDTQIKAKMLSAAFADPHGAEPIPKKERLPAMAAYFASLKTDAEEKKEVRDYISGNGIVRILWRD